MISKFGIARRMVSFRAEDDGPEAAATSPGSTAEATTSIRTAVSGFEALRLLLQIARRQRERVPGTGPTLSFSLLEYQACPLSNPGIYLCIPGFLSRPVRYQLI